MAHDGTKWSSKGACKKLADASGSAKVIITLSDIRIGDGTNGVDLTVEVKAKASVSVGGISMKVFEADSSQKMHDIIDLDNIGAALSNLKV